MLGLKRKKPLTFNCEQMDATLPDKPNLAMSRAPFYLFVTDMLNLLHYMFFKIIITVIFSQV